MIKFFALWLRKRLRTFSLLMLLPSLLALAGCQSEQVKDEKVTLPTDSSLAIDKITASQIIGASDSAKAHWLSESHVELLGYDLPSLQQSLFLAAIADSAGVAELIPLVAKDSDPSLLKRFPHLDGYQARQSYTVDLPQKDIKALVKGAIYLISLDENQQVSFATSVQFGNLLDALYTSGDDDADEYQQFGSTTYSKDGKTYSQFSLWAPTAKSVTVKLYEKLEASVKPEEINLKEDNKTGIWSATHAGDYQGYYYQYELEIYHPQAKDTVTIITTDPYSLSLSINSEYSQVVDLDSENLKPSGWQQHQVPTVAQIEDNVFYETHIRDFSAHDSRLSKVSYAGKYKAFTETDSDGMRHLKQLKQAGLNNIHLLPAFDIGTVNEDPDKRVSLSDTVAKLCRLKPQHNWCAGENKLEPEKMQDSLASVLQSFDPKTGQAQHAVSQWRDIDDYNWGYDPFHYTVPEGSYATDPMGVARIIEFREMVQSLHEMGFRVIMDVVYNHTHKAGLETTSVLDKIVPNYYQRLNPLTGAIEQSTCCDNTATERAMMAKLMVDSLVVWARDYKIDGFRFDLMGHQPKDLMLEARKAVQAVDADTYFYGEGWNFGEVADNQRFIQASQLELAGTEIGTFSDRLRDAVRGGAFNAAGDDIRKAQGIGNGLGTYGNELTTNGNDLVTTEQAKSMLAMDQIRVGLAGNLATFPLENSQGEKVLGKDIPYGDQGTGYALDPADTINYVSKHDNQTLWDNNQYRLPYNMSTEDRARAQVLSLAYPLMAQGIPFIHMGSELLRSKAFLRDSYDYGDWFNQVDFAMQTNNYNIGLPPAEKDQQNWQLIRDVINNNDGRDSVKPEHIAWTKQRFIEYLSIRMSSKLFRLTTAQDVQQRVTFENTGIEQQSGIIAMKLNDNIDGAEDLDSTYDEILVIFNNQAEPRRFTYGDIKGWQLHPTQQQSDDPIISASRVTDSGFDVGKLTVAVFVR
ncbi:pullulanase-type alpha-1,6-glucosidase [Thalassotalea litorea]|uniref:pullulanase-type alpha-1,6-glucosidase n=1 Tax=Thalassotalea litorea TaxID=2020715 RepID=UPI00373653CE